jgi:hypothetical protein
MTGELRAAPLGFLRKAVNHARLPWPGAITGPLRFSLVASWQFAQRASNSVRATTNLPLW